MRIGIGTSPFSYWATDNKNVNLIDPTVVILPPRKPGVEYDDYGWPKALPANVSTGKYTLGTEGYVKPGRYRLIARGSGRVWLSHPDAPNGGNYDIVSPGGDQYSTAVEFELKNPAVRSFVEIFKTDAANHLRSLKLHLVGDDPEQIYRKPYIEELSRFDCLRLAGFTGAIASPDVDWPAFAGDPHGRPAKWAAGFALCNAARCDPWINIPHMASDQYTASLARLAKAMLCQGQKVYVEYSIEVWNWGAPFAVETSWVRDWGERQSPRISPYQFAYAELAHHHQQIFAEVSGLPVVRVLADQFGYPFLAQQALQWAKAKGYKFDVLATAPYVDAAGLDWKALEGLWSQPGSIALASSTEQEQAMDLVFAGFDRGLAALDRCAQDNKKLADANGLRQVAYEMGPGWQIPANWSAARIELFNAAYRDPRMKKFLLERYFPWQAKYYDLGMYTAHTCRPAAGTFWGVRAYDGEWPCPKLEACLEWAAANNP